MKYIDKLQVVQSNLYQQLVATADGRTIIADMGARYL